jgi:hypothetical protein
MPNQIGSEEAPKFDISKASETEAGERLARAVKKAAKEASKIEQRYDQDRNVSTQ